MNGEKSGTPSQLGPLPEPMSDYPELGQRTYTEDALIAFGKQERAAERENWRQAVIHLRDEFVKRYNADTSAGYKKWDVAALVTGSIIKLIDGAYKT